MDLWTPRAGRFMHAEQREYEMESVNKELKVRRKADGGGFKHISRLSNIWSLAKSQWSAGGVGVNIHVRH